MSNTGSPQDAFLKAQRQAESGDLPGAEKTLRGLLAVLPRDPGVNAFLGSVLVSLRRFGEAIEPLQRALGSRPNDAQLWNALGVAFGHLFDYARAREAFVRVAALQPSSAQALFNLALAARRCGDPDAAIDAYEKALVLKPDWPAGLSNLSSALREGGHFDRAVETCEEAVRLDPDYAPGWHNLALALFLKGDLPPAWEAYRWRFKNPNVTSVKKRPFTQPYWRGEDLTGRRLLIWGEEAIGEEVMFAGMIADAISRAGHCILECEPRLTPLYERSFPEATVVPRADPPDPRASDSTIDFQAGIADLGGPLRATWESFPTPPSFLKVDEGMRDRLRERYLTRGSKPLIGLSWYSANPQVGLPRSLGLRQWIPILRARPATFVNLQYGDCSQGLRDIKEKTGIEILHDPEIDQLKNMDHFAAQTAALDLVISISNTTCMASAAVGTETWTLLPRGFGLYWYWFEGRDASPWFPGMTLFRQNRPGDWKGVIDRMAQALAQWIPGSGKSAGGPMSCTG
jgi:Flp pilus assembly protein TadD